jgi:hypothetical protein
VTYLLHAAMGVAMAVMAWPCGVRLPVALRAALEAGCHGAMALGMAVMFLVMV